MANIESFLSPLEPNQDSRVFDISQDTTTLTQFKPFLYDMAIVNGRLSSDVQFQWDEVDLTTNYTLIDKIGGHLAGDLVLTVDDGTLFTPKDKVRNLRTDEVFQVVSISTNDLTVVRGVGEVAGIAILDDDPLLILGPGMEQASQSPDENNANTTTVFNYLETFRKSFSFGGTLARTKGTPGMDFNDTLERVTEEILREIELTFIFGKKDLDQTTFSKNRYTGQGALKYISTNVETVGGTITETAWQTFLIEKAFAFGSQDKIMLAGFNFFKAFSFWSTANYQVNLRADVGQQEGVAISTYVAPTGQTLTIVNHELFRAGNDSNLTGLGIVIDPQEIRLRWSEDPTGNTPSGIKYPNGRLQLGSDLQEPDRDGIKAELFAELGLELRNEQKHAVIEDVTGGA